MNTKPDVFEALADAIYLEAVNGFIAASKAIYGQFTLAVTDGRMSLVHTPTGTVVKVYENGGETFNVGVNELLNDLHGHNAANADKNN